MPGCNLKCYHTQLVQDQDCKADSHHFRTIDFGQYLRQALDDTALVDRDENPDEEGAIGESRAGGQLLIELRVQICQVLVHVLVKDK